MLKKGKYKQKYILNKEHKELIVEVQLKIIDGLLKPRQNFWYGIATVDDKPFEHPDLPHTVNAQYVAESIGEEIIEKMKHDANENGKIFRIKHNKNENKCIKNQN
jgi:hypothetical protein